MKAILCLLAIGTVILLGSVSFTVGQGSPPMDQPCSGYYGPVSASDAACHSGIICGSPYDDCTTVRFTPTVSCDYELKVWLDCSFSQGCSYCVGCAGVRQVGGPLCGMFQTAGPPLPCMTSGTCHLSAGHEYELIVCLRPTTQNGCGNCAMQGCTAWGKLSQI